MADSASSRTAAIRPLPRRSSRAASLSRNLSWLLLRCPGSRSSATRGLRGPCWCTPRSDSVAIGSGSGATESVGIGLQRGIETSRHVLQRHNCRQLDDRSRWKNRLESLEQVITHCRRGGGHRLGVLQCQSFNLRKLRSTAPIGKCCGLVQHIALVVEHRGVDVFAVRAVVQLGNAQRDQRSKLGRERRTTPAQRRDKPEKGEQGSRPIRPECNRFEQSTVSPPLPPMQRPQIPYRR